MWPSPVVKSFHARSTDIPAEFSESCAFGVHWGMNE